MHPHRLETGLAPQNSFLHEGESCISQRNQSSLFLNIDIGVCSERHIYPTPWYKSDENNITRHHRNLLTRHPTCTHTRIRLPFTATCVCAREKRESRLVVEIENPSVNRQDGDVKITVGKPWGGPDFYSTYGWILRVTREIVKNFFCNRDIFHQRYMKRLLRKLKFLRDLEIYKRYLVFLPFSYLKNFY